MVCQIKTGQETVGQLHGVLETFRGGRLHEVSGPEPSRRV